MFLNQKQINMILFFLLIYFEGHNSASVIGNIFLITLSISDGGLLSVGIEVESVHIDWNFVFVLKFFNVFDRDDSTNFTEVIMKP